MRYRFSEDGQPLNNALSFWLAQHPNIIAVFSHMVLVFELGFPLLLLVKSPKLRAIFLLGVVVFHLSTFILMNVNFLLIPFVYLIFFDMVPIHAWVKSQGRKLFRHRFSAPT